ncbi:sigma-54-dependent Fis family transcriptional regulator [Novosphingobium flavum]|uniref:sigma-54-dependent Fis family transcriptional regulator n=1 Tax=Sphingomonadales TaxID=204457 RepID=UPI000DC6351C|nr:MULTISPECIES: sigma-54-dependent Fis family transcriptional regulator [Sphingomonadaceae]MBC2663342.1 sigma-54-dependent Fis family transcriptional regulator [Novosphingobium aerophilum]BBB14215.1 sigma54-dependent activator protein [Sphingopyxis sp. FD7]
MADENLIEQFDLLNKLRIDFTRGDIWLEESRMLLLHASALAELRKELYESLGENRTRSLLFRTGYSAGQRDAELAHKMLGSGDPMDVFKIGPELYSFEGNGKAEIVSSEIDWKEGIFRGEVVRSASWEAESYIQQFGQSEGPVCWSLAGHASGYTSRFLRRYIVFREVECVGKGDSCCRFVGKPAEDWHDHRDDFGPEDPTTSAMESELDRLRSAEISRSHDEKCDLVGNSQAFRSAFEQLKIAAASPINVLLLGESGVGKEVFARWLHDNSERKSEPFVAVNCAAIPMDLIESELFGVRKGAYTGATLDRAGRFERASGGTILLDEIGDLPLSAQVKLLRVIQNGEVDRLGDSTTSKVDVRILAATNVDLKKAVDEGRFRLDLYYRLSTFTVTIPPLRERRSDIPLLVSELVERLSKRYRKSLRGMSDRAMDALMTHRFPGNVRELENLIERGVLLAMPDTWIELEHLFAGGILPDPEGLLLDSKGQFRMDSSPALQMAYARIFDADLPLEAHERALFELALRRSKGNKSQAARRLGLSRRQFTYKWKAITGSECNTPQDSYH